ncbi:class I SAM-dependent methyltransferase [Dongia deserti]|uniref:class I SAM-dependent methyltransferase n=1 Tax=Dongia deserti TaxID=2268030 RepID=UPI000E64C03D|nr:class I SAM-dependent methyltransferase [Dongia deserti]
MIDPNEYYAGGLAVRTYDLFAGGGPLTGDIDFYRACARRFGTNVLELGVGTARIAIPLAQNGCSVTGVDLAQAMLDLAARKIASLPPATAARIDLVRGNMGDFDLGKQFDWIVIAARAFQHLIEPATQRSALRAMHRHLRPGGHLVIDLFDPRLEFCLPEAPLPEQAREVWDPVTGCRIRRTIIARNNDPFRQLVSERLRLEAIDGAGAVLAAEETSWALRWTLRQEMEYLLELCGFRAVEQLSDFAASQPTYGKEQIWIARAV